MTVAKKNSFDVEALDEIEPFANPKPIEVLPDHALQKVQTAFTTAVAVQQPRRIERIAANVIAEAKLAGKSFYYGWTLKKGGRIEGPSIDLAMCLARNYGNCVLDVEASETKTHYMLKGIFIDLETGFTCPRLFRQRKGQDIGSGYGDDRAEDMVFQIGQSKAIRNAIIRAMPAWLIEQAIYTAKRAEIEKIKPTNMAATRAAVIEFFDRYSVTPDMLITYLDGKEESQWDAEDIINLKGVMTGITEGRITVREVFMTDEKAKDLEAALNGDDLTPEEKAALNPRQDREPTIDDEQNNKDAFRDNWINLKEPGYSTYVHTPGNMDAIRVALERWPDLEAVMKKKWLNLYPETPWPLTAEPGQVPDPKPPDSKPTKEDWFPNDQLQALFDKTDIPLKTGGDKIRQYMAREGLTGDEVERKLDLLGIYKSAGAWETLHDKVFIPGDPL